MTEIKGVERPDAPNRCQAVTDTKGQCWNQSVEGGNMCRLHGGASQQAFQERQGLRNYRLTKFHARIAEFGNSNHIKSLRDEIGILRIIMEERLNLCIEPTDLILQSQPIAELVSKIERVVVSCHKLEGSMKQLVDKTALLSFATQIIDVISSHIDDEAILDSISNGIIQLLAEDTTD